MTTTIKNIDTNEIVTIEMTDPKSGCDWSADFIGNANDGTGHIGDLLHCDDDDATWQGDTETVEWWVEYCERYEKANHRLHDAQHAANERDEIPEELWFTWNDRIGSVEFNDLADAMNELAEEIESA